MKSGLRSALIVSIIGASTIIGVPAKAQFMDWVATRTRVPIIIQCPGCNNGADDSEPQTAPSTIPQTAAALVYVPSKAVRKQNLARFVQESRAKDPQGASKMEQLFQTTDIIEQIGAAMRPVGLRVNNVADAYAVWWISAWEAVNKRDAGSSPAMYQAVKAQAAQSILSTGAFRNASNAVKQEMAESLLVQAALIDASVDAAAGNPAQLTAVARAVNQGAMAMDRDLDLTKMTLTQDGFVKRSGGRSDAGNDDSQLAANDDGAQADGANMGDYALYAVAGTGLLAGMFALGKGFSKKG